MKNNIGTELNLWLSNKRKRDYEIRRSVRKASSRENLEKIAPERFHEFDNSLCGESNTNLRITREQALEIINKHCCQSEIELSLTLETVMKKICYIYGKGKIEEDQWGMTGLLCLSYKPKKKNREFDLSAWLVNQGEDIIAHAIRAQYTKNKVPYLTQLDKSLQSVLELTKLVCMYLDRNNLNPREVFTDQILDALKSPFGSSEIEKSEIFAGATMLEFSLHDQINYILDSLRQTHRQ